MPQHSPIIESFEGVSPKLADDVFVAPGAAVIADVTIGSGSSVWYGCVLRGDDQRFASANAPTSRTAPSSTSRGTAARW